MSEPTVVRDLVPSDVDACEAILLALPEWFGIPAANQAYVESLRELPGAVAMRDGEVVGFVALASHGPRSAEIHVMAVARDHHRTGVGAELVAWAEERCRTDGVPWLHVKTLGPSTPHEPYARTRAFYVARGFDPLFESMTHWGPENAALVLVKRVT